MMKKNKFSAVEKIFTSILILIFGGIILHAPFSVFFGTLLPEYALVFKSWKEILLIIATLLAFYLLHKNKKFIILKSPIIILSIIYMIIHLTAIRWGNDINSIFAGLAIDLRYILFFDVVFISINLYPELKKLYLKVSFIGAILVFTFAVLQVFVLPIDILKYIGYGTDTIRPYLTVDQNYDFIRINSTMRGPNPLGAYAMMALTLLLSYFYKKHNSTNKNQKIYLFALFIAGLIALWFSYSRSALGAMMLSGGVIFIFFVIDRKISKKLMLVLGATFLIIISSLYVFRDSHFISNVIMHNNPNDTSNINSNDGHIESLIEGSEKLLNNPLGGGVGTTGSASFFTEKPLVIENQYLFIAHEIGWLGLATFIALYSLIMINLWQNKNDWLSLGLFASGVGMFAIGMLLPVWVDDTVALVWWGFSAFSMHKSYNR